MSEIFAPAATIKQRLREMLLIFLIVSTGMFAASEFDSVNASLAVGAIAGVLGMHLNETFWPNGDQSSDKNQWKLFFGLLVIPCGLVSGGLLIYSVRLHEVTDTFFAALLLAAVLYAPLQLWRISKRVSE